MLSVIMYHYILPLSSLQKTGLMGLSVCDFRRQLEFLQSIGQIIKPEDFFLDHEKFISGPDHNFLLTFDDGYSGHYDFVYRDLLERNLSGVFFPSVSSSDGKTFLDVNKIQLLSARKGARLLNEIRELAVNRFLSEEKFEELIFSLPGKPRYDSFQIYAAKKLLQYALPEDVRYFVLEQLFDKIKASLVDPVFDKFYLCQDNMVKMKAGGMYFGGHGDLHLSLSHCEKHQQKKEILRSKNFLEYMGSDCPLVFCYPYGDYNHDTQTILTDFGFKFVFGVKPTSVGPSNFDFLNINRYNTNDFPPMSKAFERL